MWIKPCIYIYRNEILEGCLKLQYDSSTTKKLSWDVGKIHFSGQKWGNSV